MNEKRMVKLREDTALNLILMRKVYYKHKTYPEIIDEAVLALMEKKKRDSL